VKSSKPSQLQTEAARPEADIIENGKLIVEIREKSEKRSDEPSYPT